MIKEIPQVVAPFPWFGGKSRAAPIIWNALGDVPHYIEPFAGSLAVLLSRPHKPRVETVNDLDCYLANFWRATSQDPGSVAKWADSPVNEADLSARHQWLVNQASFRERMKTDPDHFDVKVAGWWVWGISSWIGQGWCSSSKHGSSEAPQLVGRQLPLLGGGGAHGNGVHGTRNFPRETKTQSILDWFSALQIRLRRTRVACGDWARVLTNGVLTGHPVTGILLDPPYSEGTIQYAVGEGVSAKTREWAIANGSNPSLRIVFCGYEGEHPMPSDWTEVPWKASGGYGSQGKGAARENSTRERLWLSPHCLPLENHGLAATLEGLDQE